MYADDILLQSHFDSFDALTRALGRCDLLLDQLTTLGFRVNPTKSALLLQLHGGSAVTARKMLMRKVAGEKFVTLPSGSADLTQDPGPVSRHHLIVPGL